MGEAFDLLARYHNVVYSSMALSWAVGLLLLILVPGLWGFTLRSYLHSRTELIGLYVSRYVPYSLYVVVSELGNCLAGATIALSVALRMGLVPLGASYGEYIGVWLWAVLGLSGVFALRHLSYSLWCFVFIPAPRDKYLSQDYFIITQLRLLALLLLQLLTLSELPTELLLWALVGVLLPLQLLRVVQAVRRLWHSSGAYVYLFLYLCTHETLPWVYTILLAEWVIEGGSLIAK